MIDVERTIISQYSATSTIVQLIQNMNEYIDPSADFDNFYSFVWSVDTAKGFGLNIWGRIVNVSRVLQIPGTATATDLYFGFNEALPGSYPFNNQPFYSGTPATQSYILSDDAYKSLILVKALANISACNARSINQLLQNLFASEGRCYVLDTGNMSMMYIFEFALTVVQYAIITQSGAIPRPAGVQARVFDYEIPCFGFAEAGESALPFNEGIFLPNGAINAII